MVFVPFGGKCFFFLFFFSLRLKIKRNYFQDAISISLTEDPASSQG